MDNKKWLEYLAALAVTLPGLANATPSASADNVPSSAAHANRAAIQISQQALDRLLPISNAEPNIGKPPWVQLTWIQEFDRFVQNIAISSGQISGPATSLVALLDQIKSEPRA